MTQIDKDIPIPTAPMPRGFLATLNVGESAELPNTVRYLVAMSASQYKRRTGRAYTLKKISNDTFRVWRVQ